MPRALSAPAVAGPGTDVEHIDAWPSAELPAQPTSFVGRDKEVASVCVLLREPGVRLLTLTGAPGIGKTRLGLRIAEGLARRFSDGVLFIPLATVRRSNQVIPAIARWIGLREVAGEQLQESMQRHLRDRQMLLLLDNFEQVTAAGPAVTHLLAAAPRLKVLVTSRALLRVYGEHEFKVPPLALPSTAARSDPKALCRLEAVLLFLQRAPPIPASRSCSQTPRP